MAILGFDSFTEATTNTPLSSHTPDAGGGAGWTLEVAQFTVLQVNDKVQHNRGVSDRARKGDNLGDDDHDVTVVCSVGNTTRTAGACGRMSTDGFTNQYEAFLLYFSATQQEVKLYKNISGTRSQLATATITLAANIECTLKLEIRAGSQKIYIDGVPVITFTEPDTTLAGRNYAGIIMNGNATNNAYISSFQSESVDVASDPTMAAVLTGTGDLTAALTTNITMATTLPGQGTLVADLTASGGLATFDAVLTGTGDLTAALTTNITMAGALTGTGTLVADLSTGGGLVTFDAVLTGTGDLTAALTTNITLAAVLTGDGTLSGSLAAPATPTMAAELRGTGELIAALSGGNATLRFATYDIYIANQLVEMGVLDDTAVTVSLSDTYTGSKQFGAVTVRLGLGRGPEVAALFDNTTKGAGLRIYRYDATTTVQTLIFDGIINTLDLDTTALVVNGILAPVKILEMKIPVELLKVAVGTDPGWPASASTDDIGQPIPDIFGSIPRSKCLYVNRDRLNNIYDYVICKERWAVSVPAMYRSVSGSSNKNQMSLINASEYEVTNWRYPGYITVRFFREQIDFGGGEHTIYADVSLNPDVNISRNPAKVLRTYLLEANQALVTESWDAAEAEYTRLGYVLDFALTDQIQLQELATDISLMLDSILDRTSLGWTFTPDIRPTAVEYQFTEGTAELTPTIIEISPLSLAPVINETSAVIVKYLPDPMASGDEDKYLGTVRRELSTSPHASPLELTFPWIREWQVADRIVDYKAKQIRTRDRTLTITGPRVAALPIRRLVSVTSPRRKLTDAIYMIKGLSQSVLGVPQLECVAWAPDSYTYEAGPVPANLILGTFQDFSRIPPPVIADVTFPSGAPYEGVEIGPAGAMKAFVTMRFVTPTGGNYSYAVVRYRVTSSTLWVPAGGPITQLGTVDVMIRGLEPQVSYDFSVQSFNQWNLTAGGE